MQLLRQAIPIYHSSHRWELRAWSFFPRINLAIKPLLHKSVLKTFSPPETTTVKRLLELRKSVVHARAATSWQTRKEITSTEREVSRSPEYSNLSRQTPLGRVFRRLAVRDIEPDVRNLVSNASLNLTRRVIEERRRVERQAGIITVTRQDQITRKALEQTKETERKLTEQLAVLNQGRMPPYAGHETSPMSTPAAAFNIEQLTEQVIRRIDDRIVAHKERMGRLF